MNLGKFLYDKLMIILLNFVLMFLLGIFLLVIGNDFSEILLIIFSWLVILIIYLIVTYINEKRYFEELKSLLDGLDEKYLFSEIMPKPDKYKDMMYYNLFKIVSKAMNDKINEVKVKVQDYREYIEEWVHEIKTPIAASLLICENSKFPKANVLHGELNKIDDLVMQTLFYARSENAFKDYFIKETSLEDVIHEVLLKYHDNLKTKQIKVVIQNIDNKVYTDEKWLSYILSQIIDNAIKYSKENGNLKISSSIIKDGVILSIRDNGIGIKESDLGRVFEKGFTGSNRKNKHSTGIGLYLVKKLSDVLGYLVTISSKEDEYTEVNILFPKSSFNKFD